MINNTIAKKISTYRTILLFWCLCQWNIDVIKIQKSNIDNKVRLDLYANSDAKSIKEIV